MGISTRGISASEKPRLVQGVGAGSGEYSPEQQAERRFWSVGCAVCARYSVWVSQRILWLPHPRRLAAVRGGQTEVVPRNFALCQISHLAGAFIFALAATKREVYYDDL